ncbi:MAG: neuromedin U [Candidatus Eiseniibacteriota bacterium]
MNHRRVSFLIAITGWCALSTSVISAARAQTPAAGAPDANALAKQTQNPVGDIAAIPFQFNFNSGGGLGDQTMFNLNFQPVVPIRITPKWNLIARTIVPFVSAPTGGVDRVGGIGDIQEQIFFTPIGERKITWGVGPVFSLPTATNALIRTGSWGAGPAGVILAMPGPWVFGCLATQIWTFKDEGGPPKVNQLLAQPFINFNFGAAWALSSSPIITANWDASSGNQWTVPLGLGITRTLVFGKQPMSLGAQYYANVERPDGSPLSQLRFVWSLIYPVAMMRK